MSEERRISGSDTLIIHQGALGDLILTLSVLKPAFSINRPDIFCRLRFIPLITHLKVAKQAFNVEGMEFARLYSENPDTALRSWFSQYRRILLFSNSPVLHGNLCALANCRVYAVPTRPEPAQRIHMTDHLMQHLSRVLPQASPAPFVHRMDRRDGCNRDIKKILIHPGSGSTRKNWPLDHYIRVYRELRENGFQMEWIIGHAEKFMLKNLAAAGIPNKEIQTDIELVDFCRQLTPNTGFIGNDSGLTHLTAWLGTPVVVIFGPSDPVRWKPIGPHVTVIRHQSDCMPCFESQPDNCPEAPCLKKISPQDVLTAIALWKKENNGGANSDRFADSSI